jgi:hypothetical protein
MSVGNEAIYGLKTQKRFVNFNKSHYLKLLYHKKGTPEYI